MHDLSYWFTVCSEIAETGFFKPKDSFDLAQKLENRFEDLKQGSNEAQTSHN